MSDANLVLNVKAVRDTTRAVTGNGVTLAPLAETAVKRIVDAVRERDRERRARIEQTLRGPMLTADDTVNLTHAINIKIDSESGRTA